LPEHKQFGENLPKHKQFGENFSKHKQFEQNRSNKPCQRDWVEKKCFACARDPSCDLQWIRTDFFAVHLPLTLSECTCSQSFLVQEQKN
jgi:hypothetical protein